MEVLKLFNPNQLTTYEAVVIQMEHSACLQIKNLLTDKTIHHGIYKDMQTLIKELITLCELNNWICESIGKRDNKKIKFESFYDAQDN